MSASVETVNRNPGLSGLLKELRSLVDRLDDKAQPVWVGTEPEQNPSVAEASTMTSARYQGSDRRGLRPVTLEEVARRLNWLPKDVEVLAAKGFVPGAYAVGGVRRFEPRHLRLFFDDLAHGIIRLPI